MAEGARGFDGELNHQVIRGATFDQTQRDETWTERILARCRRDAQLRVRKDSVLR